MASDTVVDPALLAARNRIVDEGGNYLRVSRNDP